MIGWCAIAFAGALTVCAALTPLVRTIAKRTGFVDRPDGYRKIHGTAPALGGGIAVLVAFVTVSAVVLSIALANQTVSADEVYFFIGLLIACVVIVAVGLIDDSVGMRGRYKLLGQIVACMVLIGFGVQIRGLSVFDRSLDLGLLMVPFTLIWLLGSINAINLIDGVDGLASSVGCLLCLTIAVLAALTGHAAYSLIAVAMAGALLGFLRYNWAPASIYLGDAGSMLVGLVIGAIGAGSYVKGPAAITFAVPACVLAIPMLDSVAALVRRKLTGRSLYVTDRGHIHHLLLQRGWSAQKVVLFISAVCLVTCLGAVLSTVVRTDCVAVVTMAFVFAALIGTRFFGHVESGLIMHRLLSAFRSGLVRYRKKSSGSLGDTYQLHGSGKWLEVWSGLTESIGAYDLSRIELSISIPSLHESFHAIWTKPNGATPDQEWRIEAPLFVNGHSVGNLFIAGHSRQSAISSIGDVTDFLSPIESHIRHVAWGSNGNGDNGDNGDKVALPETSATVGEVTSDRLDPRKQPTVKSEQPVYHDA